MVHLPGHGTEGTQPQTEVGVDTPEQILQDKRDACKRSGGFFDEGTQTCILIKKPKVEKTEVEPTKLTAEQKASGTFITDAQGNEILQTKDDLERQRAEDISGQPGALQLIEQQEARRRLQASGKLLAGQVGQFQQPTITPSSLDKGEALTTGVINSIPSALRLGAQAGIGAAALGAVATAPIGGIGAVPAAIIGGTVGFVAGIVSGMLSSFKAQRTDTTTAQQRVLDEGKQTLQDWVTLASSDPVNKAKYLAQYNNQLSLIDQAYRQMKLDTSRDVAKFETALPNLAEFVTFYSTGGERDALDVEMRNALLTVSPLEYQLLELANRRGQLQKPSKSD